MEYSLHFVLPLLGSAGLAGFFGALLGVGGGVFIAVGVTAAVSSILFFLAGLIHFPVVAPVALGTTIGATIGTLVMNRLQSSVGGVGSVALSPGGNLAGLAGVRRVHVDVGGYRLAHSDAGTARRDFDLGVLGGPRLQVRGGYQHRAGSDRVV
jgi:hypothetical protein